jgi:pilus assembly protein CpaC
MTSADIRRAVTGRPSTMGTLVAAFIIVILVATPQAQQPPPGYAGGTGPAGSTGAFVPANATEIDLLVGRSTVLNVGTPIARVSLTVPDVADAMVTAPTQLLIHGKQPGTISLFVWDRGGAISTYEVTVRRDLTALGAHMRQLFPGEPIEIRGSGKDVIVSGTVSSQYVIEKAADVAAGYVEKKDNVVNLLRQQEGVASNQVMLRVRFAEVSRSAVTALGANFFTGPGGHRDYIATTSTQQFPQPSLDLMTRMSEQGANRWGGGRDTVVATGGEYSLSDFLNLFIFNNRYNIGAVVKALSEQGLFQSLAEPNLITTNGSEASFLAGGEFPIPVVQGGGQGTSVSIQFKEFGVRLSFTPTVLGGDLIHLKVRPEVSSLDFANAVTVEGFRIPALSTRRTETEVELRDGQTFAIAGLLNNTTTDAMRKIPGIGDIPILGWLFKSRALQKNQTELVVMITPTIVRQDSTGVSEGLPSLVEPFLGAPNRTYPNPDPYVGSPRYPANQPVPHGGREEPPAPAPAQPVAPANVHPAAQTAPSNAPVAPAGSVPPVPAAPPAPAQPVTGGTGAEAVPERAVEPAPAAPVVAPPPAAVPHHPPPTPAEARAIREALERDRKEREREAKARAAAEKREAKEARAAAKRAEADRKRAEKLERERAKREAEVAKRNAEIARRQAAGELRRDRALAEAAARLKAAQEAYQAEIERARGGQR